MRARDKKGAWAKEHSEIGIIWRLEHCQESVGTTSWLWRQSLAFIERYRMEQRSNRVIDETVQY